jgi:Uncharacterised nucleotidyltransferase
LNASLQSFLVLCQFLAVRQNPETIETLRFYIKRDAVDWESIIQIANAQLVSPALWISLMNKDLSADLPDELKCYLSGLHNLNLVRNGLIKRQAEEIIKRLNEIGIEPILLKGAALLFTNAFSDVGTRIMEDLDILVLEADAEQSWKALLSLGYRPYEANAPVDGRSHHLPAIIRDGDPAAVELHTQLFDWYDRTMVLTAVDCFKGAVSIETGSLSYKILSLPHFIIHNMVHIEVHHLCFYSGKISLRQLLDFVVVSNSEPHRIDWKSIEDRMKGHGIRHIYRSYLHMAATLLNSRCMCGSLPTIRSRIHLKRRLLVYGSNRLQGLSWCCTDPVRLCQIVSRNLTIERLKMLSSYSGGLESLNKDRLKYLCYLVRKYVLNKK